uniref:Uncharacterized protein n=2 Tax=viral metagenome TaxID=1070528 RepID=A0A6M3KQT5_9ZZZZ
MPAVSLPTTLPLVTYESFVGDTILDDEPLDTICKVGNYLYGNHTPPLVNICPLNVSGAATKTWVFPATPSADALTYSWFVWIHNTGGQLATTTINIDYNTTVSTAGWTSIVSQAISTGHLTGGTPNVEGYYPVGVVTGATIPATARFFRLQAVSGGAYSTQVQSFMLYPLRMNSTASGAKASGFVAHEDTMLTGAGGTIHTELFDRTLRNVAAVLLDREQMVFSYVDTVSTATYTHSISTARKYILTRNVLHGTTSVLGQGGGPGVGGTITIRARAADAAAGGNGVLNVGEVGGQSVELDCDDTDVSDTIELQSDRPTFYATVTPYDTDAVSIRYITGHWTPGL